MRISKDEGLYGDLDAPNPAEGFDCDRCCHRHLGEEYGFICVGCQCERRAPDVRNAFMGRITAPEIGSVTPSLSEASPDTAQERERQEDSNDVVLARIALLDYHIQRGLLFPGMDERNRELHALIDALITAVRDDQREFDMAAYVAPLEYELEQRKVGCVSVPVRDSERVTPERSAEKHTDNSSPVLADDAKNDMIRELATKLAECERVILSRRCEECGYTFGPNELLAEDVTAWGHPCHQPNLPPGTPCESHRPFLRCVETQSVLADEREYPCADCGVLRTKAEGGTTFTVCDECWDKHYGKKPPLSKGGAVEPPMSSSGEPTT